MPLTAAWTGTGTGTVAVLGALFFDRVIRPFYPLPEQPKAPSRSLASWPRGGPARRSCGGLPRPRAPLPLWVEDWLLLASLAGMALDGPALLAWRLR